MNERGKFPLHPVNLASLEVPCVVLHEYLADKLLVNFLSSNQKPVVIPRHRLDSFQVFVPISVWLNAAHTAVCFGGGVLNEGRFYWQPE